MALSLARLAAGEKRLAAERAELTKRATELTTRERSIAESSAQAKAGLEALRERAKKGEHDAVLAELGLDYKTLTTARVNRGSTKAAEQPVAQQPAAPMTADQIAEHIQKGVDAALAKREADAKAATETAAAERWKLIVTSFEGAVKSGGPGKYEMLTEELADYPQRVHDALREMDARGVELTFFEAADKLEEFFVKRSAQRAGSAKVRALLEASKQNETDLPRAQPGQATADVPRTLTNALAAERASEDTPPPSKAPLSTPARIRAEREAKAAEERRIDALAKT